MLAGHSFGGLYVMRYAAQYPDEVAGMVLIDSTAPNATPVSPTTEGSDSFLKHFSALMSATARLGLGRLLAEVTPWTPAAVPGRGTCQRCHRQGDGGLHR